ncbi:MAG: 1-acyl-sn-glycerol-3-phosphate acyltransferase [Endomicrobium sp.]|jgi:1-acyl-sn-glycerol-3-phosphate acyltransferase|nr:1-acyl-sn-glycerol-3-phosphate acyltransferase [Endomicrobium sp.]
MLIEEKESTLYLIGKQIFKTIFGLFYRCHVFGVENIPKSGGAIIAPNHISFFDPPLSGSTIKRPVYFMAKKELFNIPIFGWIIKQTNAFPVKRDTLGMFAIKHAFYILKKGRLLLMFPEGTRSKNGKIGIARAGVGMVACNAQVPLIPVKIENTNTMLRFKQIKIKYGKPIYPPKKFKKNDYINLSQKVLKAIEIM